MSACYRFQHADFADSHSSVTNNMSTTRVARQHTRQNRRGLAWGQCQPLHALPAAHYCTVSFTKLVGHSSPTEYTTLVWRASYPFLGQDQAPSPVAVIITANCGTSILGSSSVDNPQVHLRTSRRSIFVFPSHGDLDAGSPGKTC